MSESDGPGVEDAQDAENNNGGTSWLQTISRWLLGTALLLAGIGHLTWLRVEFQAQVPPWLPLDADLVVVLSGLVEIALGVGADFSLPLSRRLGLDHGRFLHPHLPRQHLPIRQSNRRLQPGQRPGRVRSGCCSSPSS